MIPTLSIITATAGRDTLTRALASVAPQLEDGDELIVVRRDNVPKGNASRDEAMRRATGSHLWWLDDDDVATEGALATIRHVVAEDPGTVTIFRMEGHIYKPTPDWHMLWAEPILEFGRIGGPMCVVPNIPNCLGSWINDKGYGGDFDFVTQTLEKLGREPVWRSEIIATIAP